MEINELNVRQMDRLMEYYGVSTFEEMRDRLPEDETKVVWKKIIEKDMSNLRKMVTEEDQYLDRNWLIDELENIEGRILDVLGWL